ncbi:collagenase-like [Sitodiplosis mosellana]|uniref:collagenase-like n=1 Tax=Sitodiplosis mosellana TaxID=263140 RepID=UPI002443EDE9|nr:collagenase-like [Sitodiplosis mosellana]
MNLTPKTIYIAVLLFVSASAFKIQQKHSRIINGFPSERNQFPYYVWMLGTIMEDNSTNYCGGSLISDEWVLTAAHCLIDVSVMRIHLGLLKTMQFDEPGRIVLTAEKGQYFSHPDFQMNGVINDIGLVRLPKRINFTPSIQKIKLPTTCDSNSNENIDVIGIGNGLTDDDSTKPSPILRWASFRTISREKCNEVFRFLNFRTTVICIESPKEVGSSICHGDSGSGLIRRSDNTLIGVASFVADSGCDNGLPQVFTNIVEYHPWISSITGLDLITC